MEREERPEAAEVNKRRRGERERRPHEPSGATSERGSAGSCIARSSRGGGDRLRKSKISGGAPRKDARTSATWPARTNRPAYDMRRVSAPILLHSSLADMPRRRRRHRARPPRSHASPSHRRAPGATAARLCRNATSAASPADQAAAGKSMRARAPPPVDDAALRLEHTGEPNLAPRRSGSCSDGSKAPAPSSISWRRRRRRPRRRRAIRASLLPLAHRARPSLGRPPRELVYVRAPAGAPSPRARGAAAAVCCTSSETALSARRIAERCADQLPGVVPRRISPPQRARRIQLLPLLLCASGDRRATRRVFCGRGRGCSPRTARDCRCPPRGIGPRRGEKSALFMRRYPKTTG